MSNNGTTSSIEILDGNKVKLTVEVDEEEFDSAVDAAFKRIAKQVRIPGFRPGRVPRRILEVQLGHEYGRAEALREALPGYYQRAVLQHDVDVIDAPDIEILEGQERGAVVFDATVEIRPVIEVAGYKGLRIEVPSPEPLDEEVDSEVDRLRAEHAEFQTVQRPAQDGDHVNIDIVGSHGGEEMPALSAGDYDYEVGTGAVVAEIDENLRGAGAGDVLTFEADHPDPETEEPLQFEISVLAVKEAVLPDPDDAWAAQATEFETLGELRADISERLASMKLMMARRTADAKIAEALAALVTHEIPEVMVADEVNGRLHEVFGDLRHSGFDPAEYLEQTGQDMDQLRAQFSDAAAEAVKVDLALRAIATAEGLTPDDEQLVETINEMAQRAGTDGAAHMDWLRESGQLPSLRADISKSKALEWLLDNVELVDEAGVAVDLRTPESSRDGVGDQDDPEADDSEDGEPQ
ncbi:MAG: trigger factor [Acidimicrobiaceae bacterium]|nr:trigger factor [Acidimicrobiaceae bacterium]MDE0606722.1 trigger factor [Acidimicrobiaceae bacterium]